MKPWTLVAAAVGVAAAVATSPPVRRYCLTWGASAEEASAALPGDDLLPVAAVQSTRAIAIGAEPWAVWPWLVQMGSGRGGAYTYDWIENLFGLDMHSADEIRPEFQKLAVGDTLPLSPDQPPMRVEICEENQTLVFRSADGVWVWAFVLRARDGGTRLISRNRISPPDRRFFYDLLMAQGSLVMERKMLLGIRQRAEKLQVAGLSALTRAVVSS
ncbi:SRPBCC family protein [Actinoplanes sp. LDG1-06]|uniref:SRPBCC family protein n=1 Tax=Paractinoplanes ovalisporus TaxID=2810368 RepID=A0ABS2A902_9ACTN|nr:SRPBCC family protein [Actinoplanes ovalisporus]MBM2616319.1 SRPBCC family protein [Actinoplanes ovalisporus]